MRFICPNCEHKMPNVPAVIPTDGSKGTKHYCLNCGYERTEKDEARGWRSRKVVTIEEQA